jgi:hypothetical protein
VLVRSLRTRNTYKCGLLGGPQHLAFEDARDAAAMFAGPHSPGGKLAVVPGA